MRTAALLCLAVVSACPTVASSSAHSARPGGWIAYWTDSPRPSIRAVRPDGSHDHRILRTRQNAKRPRLSPDRAWVAFDGAPPGKAPLSDFDIQVVRLDGTGRRTLTGTRGWDTDAQWSPDGRRLSFTRSRPHPSGCGGSSIWIVRRDGSAARRIAPGCAARWSPDGRDLVYTGPNGRDVRIVDLASGRTRLLLSTRSSGQQPAGWSPDGRRIVLTRLNDAGGGSVLVVNADGTGVRTLARGFAGCWSPDGTEILYTRLSASALLVMRPDGSHVRRIGPVAAAEPDWR